MQTTPSLVHPDRAARALVDSCHGAPAARAGAIIAALHLRFDRRSIASLAGAELEEIERVASGLR